MKLLRHPLTVERQESPFDVAILEVATGQSIKIVSPYIGLVYLQRLTSVSTSWSLVSDVEAWLLSAKGERHAAGEFIKRHSSRIHHYPDLHAKAVIGQAKAYLGSANLTTSGIQLRTEIGVLIDEASMVQEMQAWFDELWAATTTLEAAELDQFIAQLARQEAPSIPMASTPSLRGLGVKVRATLSKLPSPSTSPAPATLTPAVDDHIQEVIRRLEDQGFTLRELLEQANCRGSRDRRQAVRALQRLCANEPTSALALENEQRLLWSGRRFERAAPEALEAVLKVYDVFLAAVIRALNFLEPTSISLDAVATLAGLRLASARNLLRSLVRVGVLTETTPGHYLLREDLEWPPSQRYFQFKRAGVAWDAAVAKLEARSEIARVQPMVVPPNPTPPAPTLQRAYPTTSLPQVSITEASAPESRPQTEERESQESPVPAKARMSLKQMDTLYAQLLILAKNSGGQLSCASSEELVASIQAQVKLPADLITRVMAPRSYTWPAKVPVLVVRSHKADGMLIKRVGASDADLDKLPRTKVEYTKLYLAGANLERSAAKVVPAAGTKKQVQVDDVYWELAQLLERSNGALTVKTVRDLAHYIALKLGTQLEFVQAVLKGHGLGLKKMPIFFASDRPNAGGVRVECLPWRLSHGYPKTHGFIMGQVNKGGYFGQVTRNRLTKFKNSPDNDYRLDAMHVCVLDLLISGRLTKISSMAELYDELKSNVRGLDFSDLSVLMPGSTGPHGMLQVSVNINNTVSVTIRNRNWHHLRGIYPKSLEKIREYRALNPRA